MTPQLLDILDHYDISYYEDKRDHNKLHILCPFHEDMNYGNASFDIDAQVFYCFACLAQGNIYQFVARMEGCEVIDAGKLIESNFADKKNYNIDDSKQNIQRRVIKLQKQHQEKEQLVEATIKQILSAISENKNIKQLKMWLPVCSGLLFQPPESKEILEIYQKFQSYLFKEKHNELT